LLEDSKNEGIFASLWFCKFAVINYYFKMSNNKTFVLQEVIDDLVNTDKSLVSPLLKLQYFGRLIKNDPLINYTTRELEGYKGRNDEVPDYRKAMCEIEIDIQAGYNTYHKPLPVSMLEKPFNDALRFLSIAEGIGILEQMIIDGNKNNSEKSLIRPIPMEMLPYIQPAVSKLYKSDISLIAVGARVIANGYKVSEILNTVRARLLKFTMEVGEEFGYDIEIASFKQQPENNKIIYNIMNTEINNTGDGNVVNTGNNANLHVNLTITKGDLQKLNQVLSEQGIDPEDISEVNEIVKTEEPDRENKRLGKRAIEWISKVSVKALMGAGKIATTVSSTLLAEYLKHYYGLSQ
jgi:hypothetical protein